MLWEVDDDTKGYLSAADFQRSYYRIRGSTEPNEPRGWFRLVEFMMIDEDGDGMVNFAFKMMNFAFKMMNFAVQVMDLFAFRCLSTRPPRCSATVTAKLRYRASRCGPF